MSGTRWLAAVVVLLAVAGCSDQAASTDGVATYRPTGHGGDGALLVGTLRLVDGCFYVERVPGPRILPVFPEGSVATEGDLLSYDGTDRASGDEISLPGGAVPASSAVDEGTTVPEACDAGSTVWIVSQE